MNSKLMEYVKKRFFAVAGDLMENPQGLKFKLESAADKLSKDNVKDALGGHVEDLKTLIRMAKLWVSRRYKGVSTQTILYVIVAVVYFVTPTDFVPDFILGLGFMDDIAVISWVLGQIKTDLDSFKQWEKKKEAKKKEKKNEKN